MEVEEAPQISMEVSDIPQWKPLAVNQVQNSAGGYTWKVDDMNRLRRFLCLGSEGGTYYIGEKKLALENAKCIERLIESGRGKEVVEEIKTFSVAGRAAKQNPTLFALSLCARQNKDQKTKSLAYAHLADICRIPTHLFAFVDYSEKLSEKGTGWGRAHRRAINNWYCRFKENPLHLAQHVTKYKNRNGWTHRDLFRLSHPVTDSPSVQAVIKYVVKGLDVVKEQLAKEKGSGGGEGEKEKEITDETLEKTLKYLQGVDDVQKAKDEKTVLELIAEHQLVREHIPTSFLNSPDIWRELLRKMPMTALIRNLGKMTSINLLSSGSPEADLVVEKLNDENALRYAKIHPFNVLVALRTYSQGSGEKGKLRWEPNSKIVDALDAAYYKCFKFVEPTGSRYCLGLDVSGSMGTGSVNGSPGITPMIGAAAMAMVTARTEKEVTLMAFSHTLVPLPVLSDMKLDKVVKTMESISMGGTDCALPMVWAKAANKLFDVFVVYTDNETWFGAIHPAEALRAYREHSGLWNAKCIVVAFTSSEFTVADPEDPGMLDMAGFDSSGPEVMRNFALGLL